MKIFKFPPVIILASFFVIAFMTGCDDNSDNKSFENEQRYFELYVASRYPDLSPTASGLFIKVIEEGTGEVPDSSDWVLINYVITSIPSDHVERKILETYNRNIAIENNIYYNDVMYGPFKFYHGTEIEGLKEGLETMKEGGKSRLMFTSDLGFGSKGTRLVGPYTSLIYDVELLRVIKDIDAYEESKISAFLDSVPESKITDIYDGETESTMYYIEDHPGAGDSIKNDSVVHIIYRGYLCDEREFDSNVGGDTLEVEVGKGDVIRGWEIGLTYFRVGGKGRLVIPYPLAYGELGQINNNGKVTIPPYETLIFDIEVIPKRLVN